MRIEADPWTAPMWLQNFFVVVARGASLDQMVLLVTE